MASNALPNVEKVKSLRAFASGLRGAEQRWRDDYGDRVRYDKQAFKFAFDDGCGLNAFKVPNLAFEAYVGTYGNSSVGRGWCVNQALVDQYFAKALNQHKQLIFDSMAAFAEADASAALADARKEVEGLRTLLDEVAGFDAPAAAKVGS